MSLIVDCFVQRAFVLTYLAMQNITSITQFDFTKLDNNAWQDEWRAEFFSNLWELREDIEMLGSEMSRTQRLVKVLAELSSDELPNSRRLRDGVQRDQDFEDVDQWEELEATREYSAQLLQRTTDSYVQAAAAEGAKFANIQAVSSKRVTALASLFVPASLCAAVLAIPNAFQGVNNYQMFWIFWVISVPLAVLLALLFFTKLGEWLQKLPLRGVSYILLRNTAPTQNSTSAASNPKTWAELKDQTANRRQEKKARKQDELNKIVYETHQYLYSDGSGASATCVSGTIGAERIASATPGLLPGSMFQQKPSPVYVSVILRISFGYSEGSPAPAVLQDYDTADKSLWTAIWIGVQPNVPDVSQANLVQPLLNWCADQESCGCDGAATEWCVTASTYTPEGQTGNAYVAVPKDATLDFEIAVNADTKKIDQKVSLNGKGVSELSDSQGMKPQIIYSANECSTAGCGTLPDFSWDVTITLSEAKEDLGTLISYHGASSSGLKTTDGGITWHAESISMGTDTDWSTQ
ncbi:hypothetical protein F5883DRAFT_640620 [Diaporthe sp. PMI_573]|nr:hypothetical protein F5883DRAFT_640620 [Diaporthaceae sp. PMI_573]